MDQKKREITVERYNEVWVELYNLEADALRSVLDDEIVEIHHIGSTSIPGMAAKPVIDLMISVKNIEAIDAYDHAMESLGYTVKGSFGIEGRRFYLKGVYDRSHHVHIFQQGNSELKRHLDFRDFMLAHPEEVENYSYLKLELSKTFKNDVEAYIGGKHDYIQNIDRRAEVWQLNK